MTATNPKIHSRWPHDAPPPPPSLSLVSHVSVVIEGLEHVRSSVDQEDAVVVGRLHFPSFLLLFLLVVQVIFFLGPARVRHLVLLAVLRTIGGAISFGRAVYEGYEVRGKRYGALEQEISELLLYGTLLLQYSAASTGTCMYRGSSLAVANPQETRSPNVDQVILCHKHYCAYQKQQKACTSKMVRTLTRKRTLADMPV